MFGEEAYEKLTPTEKRRADLFIWTGCAMHKDLNATKGGAEAMAGSWKEGEAPVKLMNKHHVAAAAAGSTELEKQAFDDSEGNSVKLTKLVGALVRHKDAKKGHQAIFRIFCQAWKVGPRDLLPRHQQYPIPISLRRGHWTLHSPRLIHRFPRSVYSQLQGTTRLEQPRKQRSHRPQRHPYDNRSV